MSFFLRADHPESQAFLLFGAEHFVLLFVLAICIAILLYLLKHMPPACAKYIIYAAAVIEPVLELSHSVLLASGENNHSGSIENNQFQSNKNNQSKIRKRSQPSLGM